MDKILHFTIGALISICFGFIHPAIGLCLGIASGAWKEFHDLIFKKTYINFKDIMFTAIGAFVGFVIVILIS